MKALRLILLFFAVAFSFSESFAESRFFKANSVRLKYVWYDNVVWISDPNPPTPEYKYAEMWTGNDTIVDGYSCVTLWDQDEGEKPVLIGYLREDENGFVWRYYMDYTKFADNWDNSTTRYMESKGIAHDWVFLYDFSNPNWEEGMTIEVGDEHNPKNHVTRKIHQVIQEKAENGETIPRIVTYSILYGIGNPCLPFECRAMGQALIYGAGVLEYWRDGELLLKNWNLPEHIQSATNIKTASKSLSEIDEIYDLQGRPVDNTQRGILIRNGKKVQMK